MVTSKGELRINSFSISALRTVNTELNSELFHGYSAPEQYSLSSWQGTWTDVYQLYSTEFLQAAVRQRHRQDFPMTAFVRHAK